MTRVSTPWLAIALLLWTMGPLRAEPLAVTLDLDGDGALDRVVLTPHAEDAGADLAIVWGDVAKRPSRPQFRKSSIAVGRVFDLSARGRSVIVTSGCGGCSDDEETSLTIVSRKGRVLVVGYRLVWDRRNGQGACEMNFLTGRATRTRGLSASRPMPGRFGAVSLSRWSPGFLPAGCRG